MTNKKINTYYSKIGQKKEFFTKIENKEQKTDQSQLAGASIKEMAKKFGIDALKSKAYQLIEDNEKLQEKLYGHDFTNMFKSKEDLLNTKKKLNNMFEKIPANIRKTVFNDDVTNFIHSFTTNDENRLRTLQEHDIISKEQLNSVINYNNELRAKKAEAENKELFVKEINKIQGDLYENFKKTGTINFSINQDNTANNKDIQTNI